MTEVTERERLVDILAEHWWQSHGMSQGSPDRCSCGVETRPDLGGVDILDRRARAFAEHQADVMAAGFRAPAADSETEWEYGLINPVDRLGEYGRDDRAHLVSSNREHIERQHRRGHPSIMFMRRRKAGSWVPIESEEGESNE